MSDTVESDTAHAEPQYASVEEVQAAIEALTTPDYARLSTAAKLLSIGLPVKSEWEDLAQSALKDTWKGNRTWNKASNRTLVSHLINVMQRLAFRWTAAYFVPVARQTSADPAGVRRRFVPMHGKVASIAKLQSSFGNPETSAFAREAIERVFELFEKDSIGAKLVECKMQGLSGAEIKSKYGLSQKEYKTISRRVNRKIAEVALRYFD